jgi:hypothetical protein
MDADRIRKPHFCRNTVEFNGRQRKQRFPYHGNFPGSDIEWHADTDTDTDTNSHAYSNCYLYSDCHAVSYRRPTTTH